MPNHRLIIITGAARSGVSMTGGLFALCGAHGGRLVKASDYDGRETFENEEVRNTVVRPFLNGINADPKGMKPLPDIDIVHKLAQLVAGTWRRRVLRIIGVHRRKDYTYFYASPLACLIWPVWCAAFPEAEWVLVRRERDEIIRSCMATGHMDRYRTEAGWGEWLDVNEQRMAELKQFASETTRTVYPGTFVNGCLGNLQALMQEKGLRWSPEAIEDFIVPITWKRGVFSVSSEKIGA